MNKSNIEMRDAFFDRLYPLAKDDKRIIILSDDFGAPSLDKFKEEMPGQFINIGISEQNMVSVAAGLALSKKIVYMYAISPFVTLRCYEQTKLDVCSMNLSVNALGVGAGFGYGTAGPTHHSIEDIAVMRALPNITMLSPSDAAMAAAFAAISVQTPGPKYIRFDRGKLPQIYPETSETFSNGLTVLKEGTDLYLIATGIMAYRAVEVAGELAKYSISAGVIDLYRLKPVNVDLLMETLRETKKIITIEEHLLNGGLGSIIAEMLSDAGSMKHLKRIGIPEKHSQQHGSRDYLQKSCGLDVLSITESAIKWLETGSK